MKRPSRKIPLEIAKDILKKGIPLTQMKIKMVMMKMKNKNTLEHCVNKMHNLQGWQMKKIKCEENLIL